MATARIEYPDLGVSVLPGRGRISTISLMVDEPEFKVYHVNMHTKYVTIGWIDADADTINVVLSSQNALHADMTTDEESVLSFNAPYGWQVLVDAGRYTVRVVLYSPSDGGKTVNVNMQTEQED